MQAGLLYITFHNWRPVRVQALASVQGLPAGKEQSSNLSQTVEGGKRADCDYGRLRLRQPGPWLAEGCMMLEALVQCKTEIAEAGRGGVCATNTMALQF